MGRTIAIVVSALSAVAVCAEAQAPPKGDRDPLTVQAERLEAATKALQGERRGLSDEPVKAGQTPAAWIQDNGDQFVPRNRAKLDNGRFDKRDAEIWEFDWPDVSQASRYHLVVVHGHNGQFPVINRSDITESRFTYVCDGCYIVNRNGFGWVWKVRAMVGDEWTEWSRERTFDVEPLNTDPPQPKALRPVTAPVGPLPGQPSGASHRRP
jgi:hypothetical protein